jgi:uncharacterized protein (TIGR03083 family)
MALPARTKEERMTLTEMIAEERRALADLIDGLNEEQLKTPSLVPTWTVRDVAAHLALSVEISIPKLLLALITTGSMDKATDKMTFAMAKRPVREHADLLRRKADVIFAPPGVGPSIQLVEALVHQLDMRRPLGISREIPEERSRLVLDFLTLKPPIVARGCRDGLRFEATDFDWSFGTGPLVRGRSDALMLGLGGRAAILGELEGEGVSVLRERFERAL